MHIYIIFMKNDDDGELYTIYNNVLRVDLYEQEENFYENIGLFMRKKIQFFPLFFFLL
jgi:hypothetical protein